MEKIQKIIEDGHSFSECQRGFCERKEQRTSTVIWIGFLNRLSARNGPLLISVAKTNFADWL